MKVLAFTCLVFVCAFRDCDGSLAMGPLNRFTRDIGGLSKKDINTVLELHNNARRCVHPPAANMPDLKWSFELQEIAQNHANKCAWAHNPSRAESDIFQSVGENIYVTTGKTGFVEAGIYRWLNESKYYDYGTNTCSRVCGHYTQAVWAGSRYIGCGLAMCPSITNLPPIFNNAKFIVCNYGPAGNFVGQRPYEEGPASSVNLCNV